MRAFLTERSPFAREILAEASWQDDDLHFRKNLPYYSTTFAGDGFALVGDAAGFIDPFYSPGMDWIAYTANATADVILAERAGETDIPKRLERHNRDYTRGYRRWFEAIYQNKYEYMGDFELYRIAFLFDLGLYYIFVASQPFRFGAKTLGAADLFPPAFHAVFLLHALLQSAHGRDGPRPAGEGRVRSAQCRAHLPFRRLYFQPDERVAAGRRVAELAVAGVDRRLAELGEDHPRAGCKKGHRSAPAGGCRGDGFRRSRPPDQSCAKKPVRGTVAANG